MIRFGIIDFVNSYPIFYALTHGKVSHSVEFVFGQPAAINAMLQRGEVDIALTSSIHFLENRADYTLLSDLGIGVTQAGMSVRLFSKKPLQELDGSRLLIPRESASSVKILKSLCTHFWKISPQYVFYEEASEGLLEQNSPVLIIGDPCLCLLESRKEYPSYDINEQFFQATKKSFVFAVIATRNDSLKSKFADVIETHRAIDDSFSWWKKNKHEVIQASSQKLTVGEPLIEKYFSILEYELASKHFHGLDYVATL